MTSASIFRLFSEYFNILLYDEKLQEKQGIKLRGLIKEKDFVNSVRLDERDSEHQVLLEFDGMLINFCFEVYKQHGEVFFNIYLTSDRETFYDSDSFYQKLLEYAIGTSNLKGSMFEMPRNELSWKETKMLVRGFDDIFLPQTTIDDLKIYIQAGIELDVLMRYLMVGSPGTGKTEAITVLANILNKIGVTIIKTSVCDKIKEKVELATLLAPSIIIFDDVDLSIGSRNKGVSPERLQDFLDVLDGTKKLPKNVGIVATTNSTALLDLAAQRPGRFDKVLLFNQLTKENVKNIVLKSLKDNFKIRSQSNKLVSLFSSDKIIDLMFNSSVTGAFIYNTTYILKMKIDLLKMSNNVDSDWVIKEIKATLATTKKVKNTDFLNDKLANSSKGMGFDDESEKYEEDAAVDQYNNTRRNIVEKLKKGNKNFLIDEDDEE